MSLHGVFPPCVSVHPRTCVLGPLQPLALGADDVVLPAHQLHGEVSSMLLTECSHFQIVSDGGGKQGQGQSRKSLTKPWGAR